MKIAVKKKERRKDTVVNRLPVVSGLRDHTCWREHGGLEMGERGANVERSVRNSVSKDL